MPTNLELKLKVSSHRKLKRILNQLGAEDRGTLNQKDIYYTVPSGLLKLRIENGNESLIYYDRNEQSKNRWSDFNVIRFEVSEGEKFFSKMFNIEAIVQKKRELFYYDNTRIHLDTVKSLGKFMELETLVINGKADAKQRFNKIINLLELEESKQIRNSYKDIVIPNKK